MKKNWGLKSPNYPQNYRDFTLNVRISYTRWQFSLIHISRQIGISLALGVFISPYPIFLEPIQNKLDVYHKERIRSNLAVQKELCITILDLEFLG